MTVEELEKFREEVLAMTVTLEFYGDVEQLKQWVAGFEMCQGRVLAFIDSILMKAKINNEMNR